MTCLLQRRSTSTHVTHRRLYLTHEVCALLRVSRETFRKRKAQMPWVQEVLPRCGRPVYLAAPIDRYVSGLWPVHDPRMFDPKRPRPVHSFARQGN